MKPRTTFPRHDRLSAQEVFPKRIRVLAEVLSGLVCGDSMLDVEAGRGDLGAMIVQRTGARVIGIDIPTRPRTAFPVQPYDGSSIPFPDKSFDTVLLVDVLHHIPSREGIRISLAEATRVAKACVLSKDHVAESPWDLFVLSAMDRVGNARFGVTSPGNYLNKKDWQAELGRLPWNCHTVKTFALSAPLLEPFFGGNKQVIFELRPNSHENKRGT